MSEENNNRSLEAFLEPKEAKRYCRWLLLLVSTALLAIAVFNVLVDPAGAYAPMGLPAFEPFRLTLFDRTARAELARRGPWDVVILGTSRVKAGFSPTHPFFVTNRVCNLGLDACRMYEAGALLDLVRREQNIRHVLLFLDPTLFGASSRYQVGFEESRLNPQFSPLNYHCRRLFGQETAELSFEFLVKHLRGVHVPSGQTNGFYAHALHAKASQRELFETVLRSQAAYHDRIRISPEHLEVFRKVIRTCREQRIELTMAINPVHALDLELFQAAGAWERFEQWKRDVVHVLAEEDSADRVTLWDFSGYWTPFTTEEMPPARSITQRMRYYFEASHFTPELGELMLNRMFGHSSADFGTTVSVSNIEAHLRRVREQRAAYAKGHPVEMELVQRIMKEEVFSQPRRANVGTTL